MRQNLSSGTLICSEYRCRQVRYPDPFQIRSESLGEQNRFRAEKVPIKCSVADPASHRSETYCRIRDDLTSGIRIRNFRCGSGINNLINVKFRICLNKNSWDYGQIRNWLRNDSNSRIRVRTLKDFQCWIKTHIDLLCQILIGLYLKFLIASDPKHWSKGGTVRYESVSSLYRL